MFNYFSLKVIIDKASVIFIFIMSFFISSAIAEVEMASVDVPIMLKYKHDMIYSSHVGKLPFERAYQVFERRSLPPGDGREEILVWKKGYKMEGKDKNDVVDSENRSDTIKYARVLELIYFIQLIQKSNH